MRISGGPSSSKSRWGNERGSSTSRSASRSVTRLASTGPKPIHILLGRRNPDGANGADKTVYYLARHQVALGAEVAVFSLTVANRQKEKALRALASKKP